MPEESQHQQDAILYRRALKFALAHRREPVGDTSLWYNEDGELVDPEIPVASVLAILEREARMGAEYAL